MLVTCAERECLTKACLAAVVKNTQAGKPVADLKSEAWRDATKETRELCGTALAKLNGHKKEHCC
jgi:hypothetical protein